MSSDVTIVWVSLVALLAAVVTEILYWALVRDGDAQSRLRHRTPAGVLSTLVLGLVVFLGPSSLDVRGRLFVTAVAMLFYPYIRWRLALPERLGATRAQSGSRRSDSVFVTTEVAYLRRMRPYFAFGAVVAFISPSIAAILSPERRTLGIIWALVLAWPTWILVRGWWIDRRNPPKP